MKLRVGLVACTLVLGAGLNAACTGPKSGDGSSPSASSTDVETTEDDAAGEDHYVFEGKGADKNIETEKVELSGNYDVKWEISGNELESGSGGTFSADLVNESAHLKERITPSIAIGTDSGEESLSDLKSGSYFLTVYSHKGSKWKVSVKRTS